MLPLDFEPRPICPTCRRTTAVCWCEGIRRFRPSFSLILLAHPREARNTVGTVRIAHQSVESSELVVAKAPDFEQDARVLRYLRDPAFFPAVLFPGPHAIDLGAPQVREQLPVDRRLALFVIDGTWNQAKAMMRHSPVLRALPRLAFTPSKPSMYGFRHQPRPYCLSTVEAVHTAIVELDRAGICAAPASRAHDTMLEVFQALVKSQLAHAERNVIRRVVRGA